MIMGCSSPWVLINETETFISTSAIEFMIPEVLKYKKKKMNSNDEEYVTECHKYCIYMTTALFLVNH